MKVKLTPRIIAKPAKRMACGHKYEWQNLQGKCTKCKPAPEPIIEITPVETERKNQSIIEPHYHGRPSILYLAWLALGSDFKLDAQGNYFLHVSGRWINSKLHEVMIAANKILHSQGRQQIDHNPAWVIK